MSGFRLLAGEAPDEIDLELASMGAPLDPDQRARLEAAAAGPLAEAHASIEAERRTFAEVRRPLPRARRSWAWEVGGAALALAAVTLLVVKLAAAPPTGTGVRAMGGLPVDVAVRHEGAFGAIPERFSPGDELHVRLKAPADGVVEVFTVQADGAVSVLEPGRPVRAGEPFGMDGAARLDDHEGREWLVVSLVDQGRDARALEAEARSLLPDPARHAGARRFVVEVTRRP